MEHKVVLPGLKFDEDELQEWARVAGPVCKDRRECYRWREHALFCYYATTSASLCHAGLCYSALNRPLEVAPHPPEEQWRTRKSSIYWDC